MTLQKEHQLTKITSALEMDQKVKGKGKKRKIVDKTAENEDGLNSNPQKFHYEWFSERKR